MSDDTKKANEQAEANNTVTESNKNKKESIDKLIESVNKLHEIESESLRTKIELASRTFEINKIMGDSLATYESANKLVKLHSQFMEDAAASGEDAAAAEQRFADQMGISRAALKAQKEEAEELVKKYDELGETGVAMHKKMNPIFNDMATKMGLISNKGNKMFASFLEFGKLAKGPNGPKAMAMAFTDVINPLSLSIGLLTKITESTIKYAMAVDNASAAFARQTGAGRALTGAISDVGAANRNFGINAEEAGKAASALFQQFPGFLNVNKEAQGQMMKTVAGLDRLGVSMETTTTSIMFMNKNLGMNAKESANATRAIAMTGKALGMSASKITKEFNNSMKSLAVYGKKAPEIFKGVAAAAQAAGVEIDDLLGLAGQFDTFAGAAEATGKLNAIMGTQLSSTKMLMANEEERIEILMRTMQAQGKSFKNMDRFTQKAIASAAGIKDMSKAQKIFGMNLKDYRNFKDAAEDNAKAEEEFNKRMKEAMTVAEKLQAAFMNFAITMGPFVENTLVPFLEGLADFLAYGDGIVVKLGGIAALLTVLGTALGPLKAIFSAVFGGLFTLLGKVPFFSGLASSAMGLFGGSAAGAGQAAKISQKDFARLSKNVGALSAAATTAAPPMTAIAATFGTMRTASVGLPMSIKAVAVGLKTLAPVATASVGPLGALATAFSALVTPAFFVAIPMFMIGLAFLMVGVAVLLIVHGIGLLIGVLIEGAKEMIPMTVGVNNLVRSLAAFALAAIAAGLGFYMIATGIGMIAVALAAIGGNPLAFIALGVLTALFLGVALAALSMTLMANSVGEMATQLAKLAGVDLRKTLGEIGPALRQAQRDLQSLEAGGGPKITSVLENIALITTGTSAEKMKGASVGQMMSSALGSLISGVSDLGKGDKQTMKIQLDGENTVKLLKGEIADADADTNFFGF